MCFNNTTLYTYMCVHHSLHFILKVHRKTFIYFEHYQHQLIFSALISLVCMCICIKGTKFHCFLFCFVSYIIYKNRRYKRATDRLTALFILEIIFWGKLLMSWTDFCHDDKNYYCYYNHNIRIYLILYEQKKILYTQNACNNILLFFFIRLHYTLRSFRFFCLDVFFSF